MSNSSIMSVREMIDSAFGERETNTIHFKLIQTILFILARQLRLLERRVSLVAPILVPSESSLSIREVKIKANVKKKKRIQSPSGKGNVKKVLLKSSSTKTQPSAVKSISGQSTTSKMPTSSTKLSSELTTTSSAKTSSDPTKTSSSKTTSDPTKTSTSKTTSEPTESSSSKTTSDPTKTSSSKTTSDPTQSSSSKSTSDPTKTSSSKTTSDPTQSLSSKTSSDPTKTSSDKTTSDPTQSSSSKTTSDPTQSSSSKTTSDPTQTSSSKTTSDPTQTSSSKTTSDPTKTTTSTKSSTEPSSSLKTSTEKSSSSRTKSTSKSTSSEDKRKKDLFNMLQTIEEQREREIRIIHQRADSHEEDIKTPVPMASLDTMVQYEKLLVVERVPSDESKARGRGRQRKSSEISVVTQGQFEELATAVREIQHKFGATGKAEFLENAELMQELRRGASLTDAMAALQLSARLEAAEKTLQYMISLVTDLAARKGVNLDFIDDQMLETQTKQVSEKPSRTTKSSKSSKSSKSGKSRETSTRPSMVMISTTTMPLPESTVDEQEVIPPRSAEEAIEIELKQSKLKQNLITSEDLENALKELTDGILKAVGNITTKTVSNAEQAYKTASKIEGKLNKALDLGDRMDELESIVSKYVEQINIMDTNLSSQMTNYQEQLTQMQHDLESGLETMAESMANSGGDTVAVAELNAHFTDLQVDFDSTHTKQKELQEYQDSIAFDLQGLLKQIEMLRETKSDRDEVADALRDKAGLGALNGLVTLQQFNAVRGDFEKRIGSAYDKFNNQEIIWQKAIDDLLRELHEKADIVQVMSLRDDIQNNLDKLGNRIRSMLDIVGEPRSAAVSRKLFRDSNCLSCSTPANMNIEEVNKIPILPGFKTSKRPPTIGAEGESKPKESGDYICYPGQPIRHPIDERAHICRRYCGGSHTMVPSSTLPRGPTGMIITNMPHSTSTALGTDGKVYQVDENVQKPCIPCNKPKSYMKMPEPSEADTAPREGSDMLPWDYQQFAQTEGNIDVTPPPPSEGFD
ncbi:mucin-5AC-like isoform X2 [Pieris brassicae]|uniref:mucin-5AC-like isoform X2 n=1 Tax=Pieris brassicae TaxID=7116 RepID=UPI001E65F79D|nr:mucin-5AC-like isoform X2 [Pieris brassicae]